MSITRRRLLGWMGGAAGSLPILAAGDRVSAYFAEMAPRAGTSDSLTALNWTRFINTAQAAYFKEFGRFAATEELPNASMLRTRGVGMRLPPASFSWRLDVSQDERHYTVLARENVTGFAYRSNEKGIIYEGVAPTIDEVMRGTPETTFPGIPIDPTPGKLAKAHAVGRTRSTPLVRAWEFFIPSLAAREYEENCPIGAGCGRCSSNCSCAENCCNYGAADCPWCCTPTGLCC
jgi:hypothetical protein